jgi:hypothetical protein
MDFVDVEHQLRSTQSPLEQLYFHVFFAGPIGTLITCRSDSRVMALPSVALVVCNRSFPCRVLALRVFVEGVAPAFGQHVLQRDTPLMSKRHPPGVFLHMSDTAELNLFQSLLSGPSVNMH